MKLKRVLFIALLLVYANNLKAQVNESFGIKFGIGAGLGITSRTSPFGYAINLNPQVQYSLSDELALSLITGYIRLLTKDTSPIADYDFIPLKLEIKIFPITERIYTAGIVGAGFAIMKDSKTNFIYGGGFGYQFLNGYDLAVKYERYQRSEKSINFQPKADQFQFAFIYFF